jgi:arsenite methyltransferase
MLEKARTNAINAGYTNVEFKKGDIEKGIQIGDNIADVVISNCVINLTINKVAAFKEIYRILKRKGRMVISDFVTSKQIGIEVANAGGWCSCIDGALTSENYIDSIKEAGFKNVEVLQQTPYLEDKVGDRKITSLVIKAVKNE